MLAGCPLYRDSDYTMTPEEEIEQAHHEERVSGPKQLEEAESAESYK